MQSNVLVEDSQSSASAFYRGMYRERYLKAASSPFWGRSDSRCGSATIVRSAPGALEFMARLCDTWGCELCGVRRAAWLRDQIQRAQGAYGLDWFMTLTIRFPDGMDAVETFRLVKRAWNILRTNIRRDYGAFDYVWVVEATERGAAHLHILTSLDLTVYAPTSIDIRESEILAHLHPKVAAAMKDRPKAWALAELGRRWKAATNGSYIVEIEPVESDRAARYITKYVTSATSSRPAALGRSRVYSRSRGVEFTPFRGEGSGSGEWATWQLGYWQAYNKVVAAGMEIRDSRMEGTPCCTVKDYSGLYTYATRGNGSYALPAAIAGQIGAYSVRSGPVLVAP